MTLALVYPDEIKGIIENRLKNNWVIFMGRMDIISQVEERVYTPGTARSADFEIIDILHPLIFGKKIDELKKFLDMPDDFERILMISFCDRIDNDVQVQLTVIKKGYPIEKSIRKIVTDISSLFETRQGGNA